jgi:hypothetical protein
MSFHVPGLVHKGGLGGTHKIVHEQTSKVIFETRKLSVVESNEFVKAAERAFSSVPGLWQKLYTIAAIKKYFKQNEATFWLMWNALVSYR